MDSGSSQGCTSGSCPNSYAPQGSCPVDVSWCRSASSCTECVSRSVSDSNGNGMDACSWFSGDYQSDQVFGCWPSNAGPSISGGSLYQVYFGQCGGSGGGYSGLGWGVGLGTVSFFVGLLGGLLVLIHQSSQSQVRLQRVALGLWLTSFVFWGACFPSVIASFLINRRRPSRHSCCSCGCTWIFILGITEMCAVFSGYLSGVIIDGANMSNSWNQYFVATLVIGLPTILASVLLFGLPRILISYSISKEKHHDDSDLEHTPLARDDRSAPIPAPGPSNSSSAPPIYYTPHPNVQWDGPSAPQQQQHNGPPSNLPPGYSYQGGPNNEVK